MRRISSESGSSSTDLSMGWSSARDSTATSTVSTFLQGLDRPRLPSTLPWDRSVRVSQLVGGAVVVVSPPRPRVLVRISADLYLPLASELIVMIGNIRMT